MRAADLHRWTWRLCLAVATIAHAQAVPTAQTDVVSPGPANGAVVWLHPTDTSQSLVITGDRASNLVTYGLDGHQVQLKSDGIILNVDVRYGLRLGAQTVDLVAAANQTTNGLSFCTIDPAQRLLTSVGGFPTPGLTPAGVALYVDHGGAVFAFVVGTNGAVAQYALDLTGTSVAGNLVRNLAVSSSAEGAVADDLNRALYVAEDSVGVWRFAADADAGTTPALVDAVDSGHLTAPVKGLALYQASNGAGYLLASSAGASRYAVYNRTSAAYVTQFGLGSDGGVTAPRSSTGIAVTNVSLGSSFPQGLLVAQDSLASDFKYVPWGPVAAASTLLVDPTFNPRGTPAAADGGGSGTDGGGSGGGNGGGNHQGGDVPPNPSGCHCGFAPWDPAALLALLLICRRKPR